MSEIHLTEEQFDKDLESVLTIISEPSKRKQYYVCEYTPSSKSKSIVHVYIKKKIRLS